MSGSRLVFCHHSSMFSRRDASHPLKNPYKLTVEENSSSSSGYIPYTKFVLDLKKGCHSSFVALLSLLEKLVSVVFSVLLLEPFSRSFPISHSSVEYLSFEI